jgi:outer membrane lipoprotein-sorting protein
LLALGTLALSATVSTAVQAQAPAVDPAATAILKRMTDYMGSLKEFSVHTQNTIEDLLSPGERIDIEVSATVTIKRPNKLLTERRGDLVSQNFYYDGKTLTLYDPTLKVYATEPAPGTLPGVLDYARETLGLVIPASDLVYPNAYDLLMKDVTAAKLIGKTTIGGVKCDHLLFRRGRGFPGLRRGRQAAAAVKLVVTDTGTRAAQRHDDDPRLQGGTGRGRCEVHVRAAQRGPVDRVHAPPRERFVQPLMPGART